jgi:hypothetical protein
MSSARSLVLPNRTDRTRLTFSAHLPCANCYFFVCCLLSAACCLISGVAYLPAHCFPSLLSAVCFRLLPSTLSCSQLSPVCLSCLLYASYLSACYWLLTAACCLLPSRWYLLCAACWLLNLCFRTGPFIQIISSPVTDLSVEGLRKSSESRASVVPGADRSTGEAWR